MHKLKYMPRVSQGKVAKLGLKLLLGPHSLQVLWPAEQAGPDEVVRSGEVGYTVGFGARWL